MKGNSLLQIIGIVFVGFVLVSIVPALLRSPNSFKFILIATPLILLAIWWRKKFKVALFLVLVLFLWGMWKYDDANRRFHQIEGQIPAWVEQTSEAILDKVLHALNPLYWFQSAMSKTAAQSQEDVNACLKRLAYAKNLKSQADSTCGTRTGAEYQTCIQDQVLVVNGVDPIVCSAKNVQTSLGKGARNLSQSAACSKVPKWLPDWLKPVIGLGDCVDQPADRPSN